MCVVEVADGGAVVVEVEWRLQPIEIGENISFKIIVVVSQ